jgi:hypothetical protein
MKEQIVNASVYPIRRRSAFANNESLSPARCLTAEAGALLPAYNSSAPRW